jgi:hypothetical protein
MTYGRVHHAAGTLTPKCADVSHLAELVRGDFSLRGLKAPSSGASRHLLPKGRRGAAAGFGVSQRPSSVVRRCRANMPSMLDHIGSGAP